MPKKSGGTKPKSKNNARRLTSTARRAEELEEMRPVLMQRARRLGVRPSVENLQRMRQPMFSSALGGIIDRHTSRKDRADDLYQAADRVLRCHSRFLRAIDAPSPNPKGAAIKAMPSKFESGDSHYNGSSRLPLDENEEYRRAREAYETLIEALGKYAPLVVAVVIENKQCRAPISLIEGLDVIVQMHAKGR